jgi:hypothetical protein
MVPISIAFAVLRYRLFEIDRLISRTISYAVVSVVLVGVFVLGVLLLSTALASVAGAGGRAETIAVASSTLLVFAIVQPVMRGVRRGVDRRFDRARYDAERTVGAFAERLRHETDMEAVTDDLATTTRSAVAPSSMALWLRSRDTAR